MTTRKDLPSEKSANFSQRLRETLQTYLGRQGNPLDRGVTLRDMVEGGWAKLNGFVGDRAKLDFGDALINLAGGEKDLSPPPTPTGFAVNAGITYVFVETDAPTFRMGHGYLQTRVYGVTRAANAPLPVFTDAVEIAQFQGQVYAHPTNPATTWHLWVKWETNDGVLSVVPAGGVNGLAIRTGEDVALLLEALTGQITESQLYADLGSRIDLIDGEGANSVNARIAFETAARLQAQAQEVADRLAGIAAEALEREQGDADEAAARAQAIASEAATRNAQIAAEEQARVAALTAETNARNEAIAEEARARVEAANLEAIVRARQIESTATGLLNQVLGADANRLAMEGTVALAKQELTTQIVEGISAEAAARLALAAKVDGNTAIIAQESLTRATQDEALASQVNVLSTRTDENTAGILQEQSARTTAISAEATQRNLLATQFRGDYEGSDLNQVTSGLIFQERTARSSAVNGLAQQITLLSAGAGEQFDFSDIWYFDSGIEGWSGISTPTATAGWLKPVGGPTVTSPAGLAIDAAKYTQIRARVRKTGTLTWSGVIAWNGGFTVVDEPTYDANGIGLVTANMPWTGTIDYIAIDAYTTQDATNYCEIDWIAIGRPSPGASSAQLYEEQVVRASQDAALSQSILTLTANLGAANALITSESTARVTADQALTTQVNSLQTGLNGANAAITTEANTRSAADTAEASKRETLSVSLVGAAEPGGLTLATLASGLLAQERDTRVTQDNAISSQVTTVATNLGNLQSTVTTVQESVSTLTNSTAQSITTLTATDQNLQGQITQETTNRTAAIATAQSSMTAYVDAGLSAEATARTNLASTVGANTAAINQEATTRSTNDAALSTRIDQVVASVDDAVALVQTESQARADADTVAASQTLSIVAASKRNGDPVTAQGLLQAVLAGEKEVQARNETQATIQQEFTTELKDGLFAESQARLALTARVGVNESAIVQEQTTRATADEAVTSALTVMIAQTGATANAAIVAESQARTTAISAEAAERSLLATRVSTAEAEIVSEAQARATADESVTSTLTALIAQTGEAANAAVAAESFARTTAISAETSARNAQVASLQGADGALNAAILNEASIRLSGDTAANQRIDALVAEVGDNSAAITNEANLRVSADSSLSNRIDVVSAVANAANKSYLQPSAPTGDLKVGDIWWDSDDNKKSYRWNGSGWEETADTRIAANAAAIINEADARANADGAMAIDINQVQARLDTGDYAAVKVESSASASAVSGIQAKYTVKVDTNGYVSGYGLISEANNGATVSTFAVRADQFYIASPSGPGVPAATPFIVRTTPTTIGGVDVPAGVYMRDAFIQNGTITSAKIANLAVDDAKVANLSAAKLTVGDGTVGGNLKSSNYNGTDGWIIRPNGTAEFGNAVVRGTVYATNGTFTGTVSGSTINGGTINGGTINGGKFTTGDFVGYEWPTTGDSGTYLGPGGLLMGSFYTGKYLQVTTTGDIYAPSFNIVNGNATFAGALSAASGTFSGTLTAGAVNAVNTVNIAGGSVTSMAAGILTTIQYWVPGVEKFIVATAVSTPAGSTGVVLTATAEINPDGDQSVALKIYRSDGTLIGATSLSARGGWRSVGAVTAFDPSPHSGATTYHLYIWGNGTGSTQVASLTATGGKR